MHQHVIILHPTYVPWSVYAMLIACTCLVCFRFIIKLSRHILLQSWLQEVFLVVGWSGAVAMTTLLGFSFAQNGTDLTFFLLYCNYLYLLTSHAIKVSIALLFIRLGQIQEYKIVNRLLVPCIALSFVINLIVMASECHLSQTGTCDFEALGWLQTISNATLGLILTIHPLRPLYLASKSLVPYNTILLCGLFSTGLAESLCSIARAIIINSYRQPGHSMKRIRVLSFWLMLETTLSISLAVIPEIGGTALHLYNCHRNGFDLRHGWIIRRTPSQILQHNNRRTRGNSNPTTEVVFRSPFSDNFESPLQSPRSCTAAVMSERDWKLNRAELLGLGPRRPRF